MVREDSLFRALRGGVNICEFYTWEAVIEFAKANPDVEVYDIFNDELVPRNELV